MAQKLIADTRTTKIEQRIVVAIELPHEFSPDTCSIPSSKINNN